MIKVIVDLHRRTCFSMKKTLSMLTIVEKLRASFYVITAVGTITILGEVFNLYSVTHLE